MAPKPMADTSSPLVPRVRLFMSCSCVELVASDLAGRAEKDLVDDEVPRTRESEGDDFGDVAGGDPRDVVGRLDILAGFLVGDVGRQLGGDDAGLDEGDPDVRKE